MILLEDVWRKYENEGSLKKVKNNLQVLRFTNQNDSFKIVRKNNDYFCYRKIIILNKRSNQDFVWKRIHEYELWRWFL